MANIKKFEEKKARVRNAKDTTANWNKANPILLDGEMGIEDKGNGNYAAKIGDGVTQWNKLPYYTKPMAEIEAEMAEFKQTTQKQVSNAETSLQNQIDNIVLTASDSGDVTAEVVQARVDKDGTNHATLKKRLDYMESLSADYTNQIPISTDTDGSIYDSDGYAENMYMSGGVPTSRSGIDCSGFIPIGCGSSSTASGEQVVRMSGVTAALNTSFRIAFYDADKNYIGSQIYGSQFSSNSYGVTVPHEVDENGNVTMFDLTAVTGYLKEKQNSHGITAFIRISCPNIDGNSVLTVNESIAVSEIAEKIKELENLIKNDTDKVKIAESVEWLETNGDTTKLYVLLDGYIYAYVEVESGMTPNFTNQLPISEEIDSTTPFNGTGYMTGMYLTSSSPYYASGAPNEWATGCIPYTVDKPIYIKGISSLSASHDRLYFFTDKATRVAPIISGSTLSTYYTVEQLDTDYFKLTPINGSGLPETAQYIRMSFTTGIPSEVIITVNEPVEYTSGSGTVYEWANTGQALIPADYMASLETVSESVQTAASALVDKALSRSDTRVLRFLISSDAHQKNDHELITKGTKELAQAHGEILKLIGVDFVACLGDTTWGSSKSDNATVLEEGKTYNRYMLDNIRGQPQIWTEGNHETDMLTDSQIYGLIYSHNKGLVQDVAHWVEGYGYMDFPNQKVRVICLNTNQGTASGNVSGMSDEQVKWFAEVALNMEGKTDWSIITMGHHPLSYNTVSLMRYAAETVEAFINGDNFSYTTNSGTNLAIDYSDKNCQYVGHFHGHAHAFSVVKMQKYVSSGVYEEFDAWEICIPNACYERNNQYLNNGEYSGRYSTETTYSKSDVDGQRTSFNLVTVCLDEKKIYADNYGAGIDREIAY